MHARHILIPLLLILLSFPGRAQWHWLNPLPEGNEFFDMTFVTADKGWVVGGNGAIMMTTDGGNTWTAQTDPLRTTPFICLSVVFTDQQTGLVSANNGSLLRTSNGGLQWQLLPGQNGTIQKLRKAPDGSIWGFGSLGTLARTTDAGLTWTAMASGVNTAILDIAFRSATEAVAVCGNGIVLQSSDNGAHWTQHVQPVTTDIVSVSFPTPMNGYALQKSRYLLRTTDGGSVWTDTTFFVNQVRTIVFADASTGWLLSTGTGSVFRTTNGGQTWIGVVVDSSNRAAFENVYCRSALEAIILGEGGGMYRTTDGGATWTQLGNAVTRAHAYSVAPVTDSAAWVFGDHLAMFTSDGGMTWSQNRGAAYPIHVGVALSATRLITGGTQGEVFLSTDAGATWAQQTLAPKGQIERISFLDANTGWLCGNHGTIAKTTDSGETWTFTDPGVTYDFHSISSVSGMEAWVCGDGGRVLRTTDGGNTWQLSNPPTTSNLLAIEFTSATNGWVGGQLVLYATTNGGQSWQQRTLPGLDVVYGIDFTDASNGFLLLSRGLARTRDGGQSFYRTDYPATGLRSIAVRPSGRLWLAGDFGTIQTYSPAAAIFLNPQTLDFGDVPLNLPKELSVVIENTGETALQISNVAAVGPGFMVKSLSRTTLQPRDTASAVLRFAPTDTGMAYGIATILSNAALGIPSVNLIGHGLPAALTALTHAPDTLDFGKIRLGTITSKTVVIQNRNANGLLIRDEYIVGADSIMFQIGRPSGFFLSSGQVDSIQVVFAPRRPEVFTGDLVVESNDLIAPYYRIPLRGEAINPKIVLEPDSMDFGWVYIDSSKTIYLKIRNDGTADLVTSNHHLAGSDAVEFSFIPPPSRTVISPGSSLLMPVTFTPKTRGPKKALLVMESDDIINPGVLLPLTAQSTYTGVEGNIGVPEKTALGSGYPNPVSRSAQGKCVLPFSLQESASIDLGLFDMLGRRVATVASGPFNPGTWSPEILTGELPAGVYAVRLQVRRANGVFETRSSTLVIVH